MSAGGDQGCNIAPGLREQAGQIEQLIDSAISRSEEALDALTALPRPVDPPTARGSETQTVPPALGHSLVSITEKCHLLLDRLNGLVGGL